MHGNLKMCPLSYIAPLLLKMEKKNYGREFFLQV